MGIASISSPDYTSINRQPYQNFNIYRSCPPRPPDYILQDFEKIGKILKEETPQQRKGSAYCVFAFWVLMREDDGYVGSSNYNVEGLKD